jgi:hypothetical protein
MDRKRTPAETKVGSIRPKGKRTSTPTEELRDFIALDDQVPKTIRYRREPSLDLCGKNTGAGNLFMAFGERDIEFKKKGDELTAEVNRVDVYDPTSELTANASTDDIACWLIDSD